MTEEICQSKPDFVLSAFEDNAGFVKLDDDKAVCLKVETHNHPSAIEPYAGANTGLGGVIRDILGAHPGQRLLVIVGASHKGYLDAYLDEMHDVRIVDPEVVLR